MKIKKPKNKKAFTLAEVMVSLTVLSIGMVSVTVLMTNNIKGSADAKNQTIALLLAQEGAELIRNIKDNNSAIFKSGSNGCFSGNVGWYNIGKNIASLVPCKAPSAPLAPLAAEVSSPLYVDDGASPFSTCPTAGFYTVPATCSGANRTATKFYREYYIDNSDTAGKKVTATVYVTWNSKGFPIDGSTAGNCNLANKCVSVTSVVPD